MKAEFDFDGERLRIWIKVEDRCELALAKVIEKYNRATVSLRYPDSNLYSYHRDQDPKAVEIILRESPKCPANGEACQRGCVFIDGSRGCELVPACDPERFAATREGKEG